ncbi:hypothetical protein Cni_G28632 [Canna indica]|uniref:Uncharacterized protein n=1 Tax=Canna indica TaxID=4628 RepID=A0AAQ3QTA3_9LILI|nr:hypothetical protein Cni_G28632 [Canna indica]
MDLLEVPFEEAALRLYSLPGTAAAGSSAWACAAAVIAAVVGLWGIRTVGSKSDVSPLLLSCSPASPPSPPLLDPVVSTEPHAAPAPEDDRKGRGPIAPLAGFRVEEASGAKKARYTAYYLAGSCDDCGVVEEEECEDDREDDGGIQSGARLWATAAWDGDWRWEELTAARRRWDLGWYRFQDMTALDGSVVRLWDGGLTARTQKLFMEG